MPKITPIYASDATEQTTTSTSYQTAESIALTSGTYVIFGRCEVAVASTGNAFVRMGDASETTLSGLGNSSQTDYYAVTSIVRYTATSSVNWNLTYAASSGATAKVRNCALLAIPLNQLNSSQHYQAYTPNPSDSASPSSAAAYTAIGSLTADTDANGETWFVMCFVVPGTDDVLCRLNKNSGVTTSPPVRVIDNSGDLHGTVLGYAMSLDDGDTITLEGKKLDAGDSPSVTVLDWIAFNLSEFDQSFSENGGAALTSASGEAITSPSSGYAGEATGTTRFVMFNTGLMQSISGMTSAIEFYETEVVAGQYTGSIEAYNTGPATDLTGSIYVSAFSFHMETVTNDSTTRQQYLYTAGGFEEYDTDPPNMTMDWPGVAPTLAFFEANGSNIGSSPTPAFGFNSRHIQMNGGAVVMQGGLMK